MAFGLVRSARLNTHFFRASIIILGAFSGLSNSLSSIFGVQITWNSESVLLVCMKTIHHNQSHAKYKAHSLSMRNSNVYIKIDCIENKRVTFISGDLGCCMLKALRRGEWSVVLVFAQHKSVHIHKWMSCWSILVGCYLWCELLMFQQNGFFLLLVRATILRLVQRSHGHEWRNWK